MSDPDTAADWRALCDELEAHGVPARQAEAVARRAWTGATYATIGEEMGVGRAAVARLIGRYRDRREQAAWLAKHGPDI